MLLDNEDKISVSITSSWHGHSSACLPFPSCFQSGECNVPHKFADLSVFICFLVFCLFFFQIDRVVEELENRPELQHVVPELQHFYILLVSL